jgi:ribosomal protein L37E
MNREGWLSRAIGELRPRFEAAGYQMPTNVKASCGFPKGARATGQIFDCKMSEAGMYEIFINPQGDDSLRTLQTLLHEMVHAAVGTECGHRKPFKHCKNAVGIQGPYASESLTPECTEFMAGVIDRLGPYPHKRLVLNEKKQTTRLLKVVCPSCGYTVRTTLIRLAVGVPTCPCGTEMVAVDAPGGESVSMVGNKVGNDRDVCGKYSNRRDFLRKAVSLIG